MLPSLGAFEKSRVPEFVVDQTKRKVWSYSRVPVDSKCKYCVSKSSSAFADSFEFIVAINLHKKPERLLLLYPELHVAGLCQKAYILHADAMIHSPTQENKSRHSWESNLKVDHTCKMSAGSCGCYTSHALVSFHSKGRRTLVLEDDVEWTPEFRNYIHDCKSKRENRTTNLVHDIEKAQLSGADQILLGSISWFTVPSLFSKRMYRTKGVLSHAIVMFKTGQDKLLQSNLHRRWKGAVDTFFCESLKQYTHVPSLASQSIRGLASSGIKKDRSKIATDSMGWAIRLQSNQPHLAVFGVTGIVTTTIILLLLAVLVYIMVRSTRKK